jgi:plastocyanin
MIALLFVCSNAVYAQKWADLTMTVVLDGLVPVPQRINAFPGGVPPPIFSEDLVVDPATKGIANVVFMIDSKRTKLTANQWHPDLQMVPAAKPTLEVVNFAFVPHVLSMRAGQTLVVKNPPFASHNPKFNFFKNEEVNPMILAGANREVATEVEEPGPTKVECSIHPWMSGFVIVSGHPYVGISDATGKIKIEKLPADIELDFKLWHESQDQSIDKVTLAGRTESWPKGTVKLTLIEGENDLGTLSIKSDKFRNK